MSDIRDDEYGKIINCNEIKSIAYEINLYIKNHTIQNPRHFQKS